MATLDELLAQIAQQQQPQSNIATLGNVLGAGLNIAGGLTGRGAIGNQVINTSQAIANQQQRQQALQQQQLFGLARLAQSEKKESRIARKEQREEQQAKAAQVLQSRLGEFGDILGQENLQLLQLMPSERAADTVAAFTKGRLASKTELAKQKELAVARRVSEIAKRRLEETEPTKLDRARQLVLQDPERAKKNPIGIFLDAGFSAADADVFSDTDTVLKDIGIEQGFWSDAIIPGLSDQVEAQRQRTAEGRQSFIGSSAPQPASQPQQSQVDLRQAAIISLQQRGKPVNEQTIQQAVAILEQNPHLIPKAQ